MLQHYQLYQSIQSDSTYFFTSVGKQGTILKRINFLSSNTPGIEVLTFGDDGDTMAKIHYTKSNNGDMRLILATILAAVDAYTKAFPDKEIFLRGSTRARQTIYRKFVDRYFKMISADFEIFAIQERLFRKKLSLIAYQPGMRCKTFLVRRKKA